jgi:cation transport ATPase
MSLPAALLSRPPEQRRREYKYRCAQSIVFGLPVIALQLFGRRLGGPEAALWAAVLQAVLAGWIVYVGAVGMLVEGVVLLRHRLSIDLLVAVVAIVLYLGSLAALIFLICARRPLDRRFLFDIAVTLLAAWTGVQWYRFSRMNSDARRRFALPLASAASRVSPDNLIPRGE